MKGERAVETERTDLGTWLAAAASQIRNHGLALVGLAEAHFSRDERVHQDLYELCSSIERTAKVLDAAADQLCQKCGMVEMEARVTFGTKPGDDGGAESESV